MDGATLEGQLRAFFADAAADVVAVYLYGSYARGTANERSDVDLAILYVTEPPRTLEGLPLDIESDLERIPCWIAIAPVGFDSR